MSSHLDGDTTENDASSAYEPSFMWSDFFTYLTMAVLSGKFGRNNSDILTLQRNLFRKRILQYYDLAFRKCDFTSKYYKESHKGNADYWKIFKFYIAYLLYRFLG